MAIEAEEFIEQQKIIALASNLARLLGKKQGTGRRYVWPCGDLHVYVDDEKFFTLAHWRAEIVVSTVEGVFISGEWVGVIRGYCEQIRQAEQQAIVEKMRQAVFA